MSAFILAGCLGTGELIWPTGIPEKSYFESAYELDAENQLLQGRMEYLDWVKSFYLGTVLYPNGWLQIQTRALTLSGEAEKDYLTNLFEELGKKIGAEWAKENALRVIDNRLLAIWGTTIQLAVGTESSRSVVDFVAADVRALLVGEIKKDDISESRYDSVLGVESFDSF
ncbi:MAG: hypothetical protein P8P42_10160 [Gammaproteobacteria bacterium]|nr:hypothetical protein [Gammaproteobacteria bacterium]